MSQALGIQLLVELYECNNHFLNDVKTIEAILLKAAEAANATVVNHCFHEFSPHGVSGVVVIAESHITVHTWPELKYCAIDIFTCGNLIDNNRALEVLKEGLESQKIKVFKIERGLKNQFEDSVALQFEEKLST